VVEKSPLVSVVVPTRDRSELLTLTLKTVLWQREVELEVIVVDDGSIDDTAAAVERLRDPRIQLVQHHTPQGVSRARNHGIQEARGRWIAFLDDDNLWSPHKLASQLRAAGSTAPWVYTGDAEIDWQGRIIAGQPPLPPDVLMRRLPRWNVVPGGCSGVIATREAIDRVGGFDPGLINVADWDLWIRLSRIGPPAWVPEPLMGYRSHPGQTSLDVGLILQETRLLERRYGRRVERGELHHYLAYRWLVAGNRREALKHFARAALRGEAIPVVTNLAPMVLDRSGVRLPRSQHDPHAAWRAQAQAWLSELA
jgi:glycosyltransferase involved in cell wall biosynthesis